MPRYHCYHFDLIDGRTVADEGGLILEDDVAASDAADRPSAELYKIRPELRGKRYAVLVTNVDGEEVHRALLDREGLPPVEHPGLI